MQEKTELDPIQFEVIRNTLLVCGVLEVATGNILNRVCDTGACVYSGRFCCRIYIL